MTGGNHDRFDVDDYVGAYDLIVNCADTNDEFKDDPQMRIIARYAMLLCINNRQATEIIVKRMGPEEKESVRKAIEEFSSGLIELKFGERETKLTLKNPDEFADEFIQRAEMVLSVFDSCNGGDIEGPSLVDNT